MRRVDPSNPRSALEPGAWWENVLNPKGNLSRTALLLLSLVAIVPPAELGPRLSPLLAAGSGDDGRIAMFLRQHPSREAMPALVAALERHEADEDGTIRRWIVEALEACAGEKAGTTAAAWRMWLANTRGR